MSLSEEFFRNKARVELRETEARKQQSLRQLREWIKKNPFLINAECIDDTFLLAHLRARKYSMDKVFVALNKFIVTLAQYPHWFEITPERLEKSLQMSDAGCGVIFKRRDRDGCRVLLVNSERPGELRCSLNDELRLIILTIFFFIYDEETQVSGIKIILDCRRLTTENVVMTSLRTLIDIVEFFDLLPIRVKEVNIVGFSAFFVAVYDVVKRFLSAKLKSRVRFHKSFDIPAYGADDVIDSRQTVEEKRAIMERILKVKGNAEALRKFGKMRHTSGVGSFRKLEID